MMLIIIKIYKNVIKNKKQKSASLLCNDVNLLCLSLLAILNVIFRGPKKLCKSSAFLFKSQEVMREN